jgi:hypothetical protein
MSADIKDFAEEQDRKKRKVKEAKLNIEDRKREEEDSADEPVRYDTNRYETNIPYTIVGGDDIIGNNFTNGLQYGSDMIFLAAERERRRNAERNGNQGGNPSLIARLWYRMFREK